MTLAIACPTCKGRGWIEGVTEWPDFCPHCQGRGAFLSFSKLAKRLGVTPRQLRAVERLKAGPKVSAIVLERICESFPHELGLKDPQSLFPEGAA